MGSLTLGQDRFHNTLIVEQMIQLWKVPLLLLGNMGGYGLKSKV